ncbi:PAAR domain-containing protein [Sphaerothrix gracilis]|uniref:PAAR domain-containing protein n=1 Tax=Sphaerothrix gracilis TaxID=3151835 RepID=UPI0031FC423C
MGQSAARIGDTVAHLTPPVLTGGPGSLNVMIGGQPAWRGIPLSAVASLPPPTEEPPPEPEEGEEGPTEEEQSAQQEEAAAELASMSGGADIHACVQPSPVPFCVDGPGVVITGSATVMINGLPACRQGDMILEVLGPPNSITSGCPNVQIGG